MEKDVDEMRTCECSNCKAKGPLARMIGITVNNKTIGRICPACQQAKKIQITLVKEKEEWKFYQYFPVEC